MLRMDVAFSAVSQEAAAVVLQRGVASLAVSAAIFAKNPNLRQGQPPLRKYTLLHQRW